MTHVLLSILTLAFLADASNDQEMTLSGVKLNVLTLSIHGVDDMPSKTMTFSEIDGLCLGIDSCKAKQPFLYVH